MKLNEWTFLSRITKSTSSSDKLGSTHDWIIHLLECWQYLTQCWIEYGSLTPILKTQSAQHFTMWQWLIKCFEFIRMAKSNIMQGLSGTALCIFFITIKYSVKTNIYYQHIAQSKFSMTCYRWRTYVIEPHLTQHSYFNV